MAIHVQHVINKAALAVLAEVFVIFIKQIKHVYANMDILIMDLIQHANVIYYLFKKIYYFIEI